MAPRNAHTAEQRAFIIWSLANCVQPETIVDNFNRRWKTEPPCGIGDIAVCDPRRLAGEDLVYFNVERENFLQAPTADKRVRMALLNRVIIDMESRGAYRADPSGLVKLMELQAKEDAGFFAPKVTPGTKASGSVTFKFEDAPLGKPPY